MSKEKYSLKDGVVTFHQSAVNKFRHTNPKQRWGEAFYHHMQLQHITTQPAKDYCERIYLEISTISTKAMVTARLDPNK